MLHPVFSGLSVPVIAAPMFLVSGLPLVAACCAAGIVGSFPALNARSTAELDAMLDALDAQRATPGTAPYAVNLTMRLRGSERFESDLAAVVRHRVPVVITSVGDPAGVVDVVHGYGGVVLHDVVSLRHARKAAEAGVDGLILVCAGAGGHSGRTTPFAFVPEVRAFFDGILVAAGGIASGAAVHAARVLGADLAYIGTRLIATEQAGADPDYKAMIVASSSDDVVHTPAFTGVPANFLAASIRRVGLDPQALPTPRGVWQPDLPDGLKAWRDVWSAGHGTGLVHDVPGVSEAVARLRAEYAASLEAARVAQVG